MSNQIGNIQKRCIYALLRPRPLPEAATDRSPKLHISGEVRVGWKGTTRAMYNTVTRRDAMTSGESEPTLIRFGVQAPVPSGGAQLGLAA